MTLKVHFRRRGSEYSEDCEEGEEEEEAEEVNGLNDESISEHVVNSDSGEGSETYSER